MARRRRARGDRGATPRDPIRDASSCFSLTGFPHCGVQALEHSHSRLQLGAALPIERLHSGGEIFHPSRSASAKNSAPFCGRVNLRKPSVLCIPPSLDETVFFETADDPRHRRRLYLFGGRELSESKWTPENDDGQCR